MNGQARIPLSRLFSASVLLLGSLSLAACVSPSGRQVFAEVPVNPTSPAKAQIEAVLAQPAGDFPSFASIPAPPADLPTPEGVKAQVQAQQAEAATIVNSSGPETWYLQADDAFVARARADARVDSVQAPTEADIAESQAFVAAAKARAKAPPKPK
ncbi:hypothetical protein AMEJIAPC_01759 [Caulobacter sp. NIBR1757]|nr:hypothetical protein AMEJIAPC_01759 [Caulobacter sp. NIBR1757]